MMEIKNNSQPKLLTANQVSHMLSVSIATIHRWTREGVLRATRTVGGHRRYQAVDIEELLNEREKSNRDPSAKKGCMVISDLQRDFDTCSQALDRHYAVHCFPKTDEVLIDIAEQHPDLLIIALDLDSSDSVNMLDVIHRRWPDLKTLFILDGESGPRLNETILFNPFSVIRRPYDSIVLQAAAGLRKQEEEEHEGLNMNQPASSRILIVDDDERLADTFCRLFQKVGYGADFAANGYQAGRMIYEYMPHLIVLDYAMPGMTGTDLLSDIRKTPSTKDIQVIFMSGYYEELNKDENLVKQVAKILPKPTEFKKLLAEVQKILPAPIAVKI